MSVVAMDYEDMAESEMENLREDLSNRNVSLNTIVIETEGGK